MNGVTQDSRPGFCNDDDIIRKKATPPARGDEIFERDERIQRQGNAEFLLQRKDQPRENEQQ